MSFKYPVALLLILLSSLCLVGFSALGADQSPVAVGAAGDEIKLDQTTNAFMRIKKVAKSDATKALDLYLFGISKVVKLNGQETTQMTWTTLSDQPTLKDAKTAALSPRLSTEVPLSTDVRVMEKNTEAPIFGDISALIRAAEQVTKGEKSEEEEKEEKDPERDSEGNNQNSGSATGSQSKENNLSAIPDLKVAKTSESEPINLNNDIHGETTEGCTPELDPETGKVNIMAAPTINGQASGECAWNLKTTDVQKSYLGCGYDENQDTMIATVQMRRFWTYGAATGYIDDDCINDETQTFPITETGEGCLDVPDYGSNIVKEYTRLIYKGRDNEEHEVLACGSRNGQEYPLTWEVCAASPFDDDFPAERTYSLHRPVYEKDGESVAIAVPCQRDEETFWNHVQDTSDCDPLEDYSNNLLFERYKIRIDTNNGPVFRTFACAIKSNPATTITQTNVGCESGHTDYDGYSLGHKMYIRDDTGDALTGCQEADISYPHQRETQGYENDDANLQSSPKEALYINLPDPAGKTYIEQAVVRDDSTPVPHIYQTSSVVDGEKRYPSTQSCDKYTQRVKTEFYLRADGTTYGKPAGEEPEVGPVYDCVRTGGEYPSQFTLVGNTTTNVNSSGSTYCNGYDAEGNCYSTTTPKTKTQYRNCQYQSNVETLRGDSTIIEDGTFLVDEIWQNATSDSKSGYDSFSNVANPTAPDCPTQPSIEFITAVRNKLGY